MSLSLLHSFPCLRLLNVFCVRVCVCERLHKYFLAAHMYYLVCLTCGLRYEYNLQYFLKSEAAIKELID